jgi:type IV pilus assembly protein PilC
MKFIYQARNKDGQIKNGFVVAATQVKAEQLLAENGFIIIGLQIEEESVWARFNPFATRVNYKELVLFSRQLSTLISARVSILQSLRILEGQITSAHLVAIIRDLITSIENGESFSLALSKYPEAFANIYVSLVRSGEASGSVAQSLNYLADQMEKDYELRSKVKGALTYPIFVLSALVVVGLLMFKFVLPNLTAVLKEQGGQLPAVSVALISLTDFFSKFWWLVLLVIAIVIASLRYYVSTPNGRMQWDRIKIRLPLIGDIFQKVYLARFSRNLSTLVAGGIPIIQAIQIVSEIINNVSYQEILTETATRVTNGSTISDALAANKREFPPLVSQMVRVWEQTAQLDVILAKLATFYEKEVDSKVQVLSTLLEPMIMIILGLAVGALVAGILLPIYNIARSST